MNQDSNIVPESVVRTLTEFSCGGFILFTFDAEGCPSVLFKFENAAAALALQSYMHYTASAFEHVNRDFAYRAIIQEPPESSK